jgi:carbonic anhydrase
MVLVGSIRQLNVLAQIEHLLTYDIVRDRTARGMLKLSGMWFDIASGSMHAYDEELKRFAPVDSRLRADPASSRRAAKSRQR